ncbi:tetratricopeptide repeat protein [Roseofilum casamattae]|uniref:Tetratricopeptide repeat protein n=1 Tax=Roseofilum casamattae BLCC-M143 TaxID=3022442 RepID=A0ABT7BX54_9CYAN|nr:tetratricopeptide repeat protein [Roseofilum casamattae]MDJ1183774.1 tetratricopeptide repeat protein [Roseofilum casamattae BLCC-M143]
MDVNKQRHYRLLGSTALLVGANACGLLFVTGTIGGVVGGIIANDVVPQYLANSKIQLHNSQGQLGNHHIAEAVGLAIALLIQARAEAGTYPNSKKKLVSLAECSVKHWKTIAQELQAMENEKFSPIQDTQVLGLFSQALGSDRIQVLTEADWLELLHDLRGYSRVEVREHVLEQVAKDLRNNFASALREVLKADFAEGGKAFGGFVISMLGAIHQQLQEVRVPQESREDVSQVLSELERVNQQLAGSQAETQGWFRQLSQQLNSGIEAILTEIARTHEEITGIRLAQNEIKEILAGLLGCLQGDVTEIKALLERIIAFLESEHNRQPETAVGLIGDSVPQTTDWQGRAEELETIYGWLADDNRKLGIIVGIAGMGKSALAAKVYRECGGFGRKYWAELKGSPPFARFARGVLRELVQIPQEAIEKTPDARLLEMLIQGLQRQKFLLVLDNFESVLADGDYGEFLQGWLDCCDKTEILVTTQEQPELDWIANSLSLSGLSKTEGARLLQALGVGGELEELQAYAEKVNGHPLTLRLVAGMLEKEVGKEARLADLEQLQIADVQQLLEDKRIKGRHRRETVQLLVVLDRSFSLLSSVWQTRLLQLTVLRQGFDATLVSAMVGAEVREKELRQLAERGFLVAREQGYEFQPFIWEYLQYRAGEVAEAHQRAVEVYGSRARMPEDWATATVEDVQDYLEWFYHLCQLGEYEQAFDVLRNEGKYEQSIEQFFDLRGYNSLRIELFLQLVQYLPNHQNSCYTASLTSLGLAYQHLGEYQQAISYHQQSLEIKQKIGDRSGMASPFNNLGLAYKSLGEYQQAIFYHQQSLEIEQEIGDRSGIATSFNNLGTTYYFLGEYQEAIAYYQQSLEIRQKIADLSGIADSFGGLGSAYGSLGEHREAISYFQQSLEIKQKIGDRSGIASSFNNLGGAYYSLGEYQQAISYHQQSLEIKQEIGDRSGIANSFNNLGLAYYSLGEYQQAISYHQQSLEIKQEIGDRSGIASSFNSLGTTYKSLGEYQQAISYHQQSLEIKQEIGDRSGIADSFNNLGNAYYSLGEYQQARSYHQQSLEIKQEIGDRSGIANSFNNLGSAYYSLGEYQQAIPYYQQSLEIYQEIGLQSEEITCLQNLSQTHSYLGQIAQASYYNNQLLELQGFDALPAAPWFKSFIRFAQKSKLNLALCFIAGLLAFPFALLWIIAGILYRRVRSAIKA